MVTDMQTFLTPLEKCLHNDTEISGTFCNVTTDSVTCWPSTPPGSVAKQICPAIFGAPAGTFAYKRCGVDGQWAESSAWKGFGHSDYSECVGHLPMIEDVFYIDKETGDEIVGTSRSEQIVFLVIILMSLSFLLASLIIIIFVIPKRLNQSPNYKIWRHFITAAILDCVFKATLDVTAIAKNEMDILTMSPVCEILLTSVECTETTTYMWFVILVHFHQLTAHSGRLSTSGYIVYILIGWGIPTIPTAIWSVTSSLSYKVPCWPEYESQPTIWIVESAKIFILIVSIMFLLQAFSRMSKNSEILNTNCCYRRLYLETIGSAFFGVFMISVLLSKVLLYRFSSEPSKRDVLQIICKSLSSLKGAVLSMLMLSFNTDIRGLIQKSVRRISRQELVPASVEENEV